jgi:RimJ/RimL family protein N-acetyltransferase
VISKEKLVGKNIYLRTAQPDDAEFVLSLRLNDNLNKFIKKVDSSVENQKQWILNKQKELNDYHMIICDNLTGTRLGVIALYDIDFEKGTFDWGRWVISENAPNYTSIESVILLYDFAFFSLNLKISLFEVRKGNEKIIKFHKRFGSEVISEDENFSYFRFNKDSYEKIVKKYKKYRDK